MFNNNKPDIHPTQVSAELSKVSETDVFVIKHKRLIQFLGIVCGIGVSISAVYTFSEDAVGILISSFAAILILYHVIKNRLYSNAPILTIDKKGIRHWRKLYSWAEITKTQISRVPDNEGSDYFYLIITIPPRSKQILITGLTKSPKEISHYIECFRTKTHH